MTREELKEHCEKQVKACEMWAENRGQEPSGKVYEEHKLVLDLINASEQQKPMEKFENAKDHIRKLAGDYKCWDNRLSHEESLELCNILEQQPSDDCVSRQAVLDNAYAYGNGLEPDGYCVNVEDIQALPSVTPTQCIAAVRFSKEDLRDICNERIEIECTHGTCKDCRHWKDSDGVYRRGVGAESKCPVNNSRVFEGTFCCADFIKRGNENEVD